MGQFLAWTLLLQIFCCQHYQVAYLIFLGLMRLVILFGLGRVSVLKALSNFIPRYLQHFNPFVYSRHRPLRAIGLEFPTDFWVIAVYKVKRCSPNRGIYTIYIGEFGNR